MFLVFEKHSKIFFKYNVEVVNILYALSKITILYQNLTEISNAHKEKYGERWGA